jgi:hypothetical protein
LIWPELDTIAEQAIDLIVDVVEALIIGISDLLELKDGTLFISDSPHKQPGFQVLLLILVSSICQLPRYQPSFSEEMMIRLDYPLDGSGN